VGAPRTFVALLKKRLKKYQKITERNELSCDYYGSTPRKIFMFPFKTLFGNIASSLGFVFSLSTKVDTNTSF